MIFTVILLYPCLLLESLVDCASIQVGSQAPPVASQLQSSRSNLNVSNNSSPLATNSENDPLEDPSSLNNRRTRQLSTSEWIFSSLVQPAPSASSLGTQNRRGSSSLAYRSLAPLVAPSSYYTQYYRNHNIYADTPGRGDRGDDKAQGKLRYNGIPSDVTSDTNSGNGIPQSNLMSGEAPALISSRRISSSSSVGNGYSVSSATSKSPEVLNLPNLGTTGLSRTAPATDPTLMITERSTSTQEMQISDDDLQLEARAEIGRKRGRNMEVTEPLYFEENSQIIFPGKATVSNAKLTLRPFEARHIDGWRKIHEMRKKSQSLVEVRKSSIASDQSADAKLITLLTIHGTPKCASKNGYCEDIDSYPRSFFNEVLNNKTLSPEVFNDVFGETNDNSSVVNDVEFKLRHDLEETPLCTVREHTIYPKAAQNRKGKFMYIVNHDEYMQGIRVETCTREHGSCMFSEGHPPGYTSVCKQKFIYKKLLALNPEGKAMPDNFRLPSCCVCHFRSMFISDRINPGTDFASDIQPTAVASDDISAASVNSTTIYPHHDDILTTPSTTERDDSGITFPTTSKDDLLSYQVPSPTTSTSSSQVTPIQHQTGGQQNNRAENQTANDSTVQRASLRQEFIFIIVVLLLSFLLRL